VTQLRRKYGHAMLGIGAVKNTAKKKVA